MNWMFPKAVGVFLIALTGLFVNPEGAQDHGNAPPPPNPGIQRAESGTKPAEAIHDHARSPSPKTDPTPKVGDHDRDHPLESSAVQPVPLQPRTVESRPPPDDLRPVARAMITTWNGEEVPKVWPAGVPMDLTSQGSVAGNLPQSIYWDIRPRWVDKYSRRMLNNRQVSIATGTKSKTIRVTLYVAKDDTFDMASVTVTIRPDPSEPGNDDRPQPGPRPPPGPEPGPQPEPQPEPTPPPQPVTPLTDLGQQVYDIAKSKIPDITQRKNQVHALANSFDKVASDISQAVAGVPSFVHLTTPQGIIDATVKSNRAVIGADRDVYVPFFTALNEILKPLAKTTLSTPGGHISAWQDIAAGLRAAAP
jgi:hypothetical protein